MGAVWKPYRAIGILNRESLSAEKKKTKAGAEKKTRDETERNIPDGLFLPNFRPLARVGSTFASGSIRDIHQLVFFTFPFLFQLV